MNKSERKTLQNIHVQFALNVLYLEFRLKMFNLKINNISTLKSQMYTVDLYILNGKGTVAKKPKRQQYV